MTTPGQTRGRPPSTSRSTLQEAAFELFLERGYAHTNVEQIASRAGVSRGTFFNHFAAKSDVFWTDVDDRIDVLDDLLGQLPASAGANGVDVLADSLQRVSDNLGSTTVPWLLTHSEISGAQQELQASALARFARFTTTSTRFLRRMHPDASPLTVRTIAFAIAGAVIAAAESWAEAGTERGAIRPHLHAALAPVRALAPTLTALDPVDRTRQTAASPNSHSPTP